MKEIPSLFSQIQSGDRVTILTPRNQKRTGRAVIKNRSNGWWVLNMGGKHGTPALATPSNTIRVTRPKTRN